MDTCRMRFTHLIRLNGLTSNSMIHIELNEKKQAITIYINIVYLYKYQACSA